MSKSPAFQFYAADYLADESVQLMTLEEEGIYIRLLAYCWREGSIPADEICLSRLCKNANGSAITLPKSRFIPHKKDATRLVHPRLEEERKKQEDFRSGRAKAGKKGASNRWKSGNGSANGKAMAEPSTPSMAQPMANDGSSSSSSSSSSDLIYTPQEPDAPGGRPGERPTQLQFRAECARYLIPAWYSDQKFADFESKGWKSGNTAVIWREAARHWVARSFENDGKPIHPPPPVVKGKNWPLRSTPPNHANTDEKL